MTAPLLQTFAATDAPRATFRVHRAAAAERPRSVREDLNMDLQLERARMDRLQRRYTCHMLDYQSTCATADTHQIFLAAMLGEILRYQRDQIKRRVVSVAGAVEGGVELTALRENATVKMFHLRAALKEIHRQIFGAVASAPTGEGGRRAAAQSTSSPPAPSEDRYARQLRDISTFRLFDPIKPRVDTAQTPLRCSTPPRG